VCRTAQQCLLGAATGHQWIRGPGLSLSFSFPFLFFSSSIANDYCYYIESIPSVASKILLLPSLLSKFANFPYCHQNKFTLHSLPFPSSSVSRQWSSQVWLSVLFPGHSPPLPLGMDWCDMSSSYPYLIPKSYPNPYTNKGYATHLSSFPILTILFPQFKRHLSI
jgi:hypothetical protein